MKATTIISFLAATVAASPALRRQVAAVQQQAPALSPQLVQALEIFSAQRGVQQIQPQFSAEQIAAVNAFAEIQASLQPQLAPFPAGFAPQGGEVALSQEIVDAVEVYREAVAENADEANELAREAISSQREDEIRVEVEVEGEDNEVEVNID